MMKDKIKKSRGKMPISLRISLWISGALFVIDGLCAFIFGFMPVSVPLPVMDAFMDLGFGWTTFVSSGLESLEEAMQPHPVHVGFSVIGLILGFIAVYILVSAVVSIVRAVESKKIAKQIAAGENSVKETKAEESKKKTARLNAAAVENNAEESNPENPKKKAFLRRLGLSLLITLGVSRLLFAVYGLCARFLGHIPLGRKVWGGECTQEAGFGWLITKTYPLSSGINPEPSRTYIDIYPQSLINGTVIILIAVAAVVFILGAIKDAKAKKAAKTAE